MARFIPAMALTALAACPGPAWLGTFALLAFPLYLIAATAPPLRRVLAHAMRGPYWQALAVPVGLGLGLAWPAPFLLAGGHLGHALAAGAVLGAALVVLWRHALVPAACTASDDTSPVLLLPEDDWGIPAWLAATCMVLMALACLAVAWRAAWPDPLTQRIAVAAYAVVLAPGLACAAIWASRRQWERNRSSDITASSGDHALPAAGAYAPGPSVDAALYSATRAGRMDEALALLDMGADPYALPAADARDQRSLPMIAAVQSDLRLLRALIALGVDLNLSHGGLTPLLAAVRDSYHGRPDAVLMLLANGADPRPADADGQTALHAAARAAEPSIAALLLDAGAPLDAIDAQGASPLGVAASLGNLDVAKYLIDRRAALEPRGGEPVLVLAAGREDDDPAMLRLLLRHKARIDARGRLGRTALHAAALKGSGEIVGALLGAGANPNLSDDQGVTPLMEAARAGATACVEQLAARGVEPAARDLHGRNALAIACQAAHCDITTIKALLALGVDPQQAAFDGRRPVDHAVAAGRWAHVALLDPGYVLPACLADSEDDLQDAPPLMRLRLALDRERYGSARQLLPLALTSPDERAAFFLDMAPRLERGAAQVLADALDPQVADAHGLPLMRALLALGPAADPALLAWLDRGASPAGRGGLARYLDAALLQADVRPEAEATALRLLEAGADPFASDVADVPPLIHSLRLGWRRLLDALLARGVDPDSRDGHGATALLLACELDDEHAVRRLIAQGAQPAARSPDGQTARGLALALDRPHLSRWMEWPQWHLPRRALRDADLVAAAQRGDVAAVERLLDLGLALDATDIQGCTALLRACGGGHLALVHDLLARGANAGIPAHSGATCLSVALTARQGAVIDALLQHGVDVDQRLPGGITPLMIAAALGQEEAILALLAHGADAQALDGHGGGVLHALAQFGFAARDGDLAERAWRALLGAGADADAVNVVAETPLLLLLGASFEPGTAFREEGILPQLDTLLRHGVDLSARERRGFGPLHLAALHGMGRVVRRLLASGADPNLRDVLNRRPAEIALMRGFVDVAAEFSSGGQPPSMVRFLRDPEA